jgi:hypothetical protein
MDEAHCPPHGQQRELPAGAAAQRHCGTGALDENRSSAFRLAAIRMLE